MDAKTQEDVKLLSRQGWPRSLATLASALLQLDQQMTEMKKLEHKHGTAKATQWKTPLLEEALGLIAPVTPPSSRVIEPQEETQHGSSTSSWMWRLAKVVQPGDEPITVTVTFRGSNSPGTRGGVLRLLQENHWTLLDPSMLEKQLATGPTPPSPQPSGPSAGIEAAGSAVGPACEHEWLADRGWAGCDVCQRVGCKALRIDGKLYLPQPEGGA